MRGQREARAHDMSLITPCLSRATTYLAHQRSSGHPSWPGGVAAATRKWREATLAPQTGWWIRFETTLSILIHHPVRSIKGSFAIFFLMSRPPLLSRRGDRSPVDASRSSMFWVLLLSAVAVLAQAPFEGFPGFKDVASEAGLTLINVSGEGTNDYIVEANGNGAAFFDYDNDGDMD